MDQRRLYIYFFCRFGIFIIIFFGAFSIAQLIKHLGFYSWAIIVPIVYFSFFMMPRIVKWMVESKQAKM